MENEEWEKVPDWADDPLSSAHPGHHGPACPPSGRYAGIIQRSCAFPEDHDAKDKEERNNHRS
jgi:hypothetical protein